MSATAKVVPAKMSSKAAAFPAHLSYDELHAAGKAMRDKCPRSSRAEWKPPHLLALRETRCDLPRLHPLRADRGGTPNPV